MALWWLIVLGAADGRQKMPLISLLRRRRMHRQSWTPSERKRSQSGTATMMPPFTNPLRLVSLEQSWLRHLGKLQSLCWLLGRQHKRVQCSPARRRAKLPRLLELNQPRGHLPHIGTMPAQAQRARKPIPFVTFLTMKCQPDHRGREGPSTQILIFGASCCALLFVSQSLELS